MSRRQWEDLVARVRGLGTRLATRPVLLEWARARDLPQLAAELEDAFGAESGDSSPESLELLGRRFAARLLRIVAHWSGDRTACLTPLFLDEDRRSVRSLLRGAIASAPPDERLAGLVPTPALPEKALEALAAQSSTSGMVALLVAWAHPFGSVLLEEGRKPRPDLLRLDLALNARYVALSASEARRAPAGAAIRGQLLEFVAHTVDLENAGAALQLASQRSSTDPAQFFLPEGRVLTREDFLAAARAGDDTQARIVLTRACRTTPLAGVFELSRRPFEDVALAVQLRRAAAAARLSPLGVAPVLAFWLRLRAQLRDLRAIVWRTALGAPPAGADALLTPA